MKITPTQRGVLIEGEDVPELVAPDLLRAELRAAGLRHDDVITKAHIDSVTDTWIFDSLSIAHEAPRYTDSELERLQDVLDAHSPLSIHDKPTVSVDDVPRRDVGRTFYLKSAPSEAGHSGTLVYFDHLFALRRVSDDAILRPAT